eukprot:103313_1
MAVDVMSSSSEPNSVSVCSKSDVGCSASNPDVPDSKIESPGPTSSPRPSNSSKPNPLKRKLCTADFKFGALLGEGAYARVVFAQCTADPLPEQLDGQRDFALKIVEKAFVVRHKKTESVQTERRVLIGLKHSNIIRLFATFQDKHSLYFVLELASKGELFELIEQYGTLPMKLCRFYTAEIVNALEYLQSERILHRDLKPENMLISADGHLKITDFGTSHRLKPSETSESPKVSDAELIEMRRRSFVGTAQYVSPELLSDRGVVMASDLWALGCVVYQMFTGTTPFKAPTEYLIFQRILEDSLEIPAGFDPLAEDLVRKLLVRDPDARLGAGPGGFADLKAHAFFEGIPFSNLARTAVPDIPPPPTLHNPAEPPSDESDDSDFQPMHLSAPLPAHARSLTPVAIGLHQPSTVERSRSQVGALSEQDEWGRFLDASESLLFCGVIEKRGRRTIWYRKRQLILTDAPRFLYVDPDTMKLCGEIKWSALLRVSLKDDQWFNIYTQRKTFRIKCLSRSAPKWVEQINQIIEMRRSMMN